MSNNNNVCSAGVLQCGLGLGLNNPSCAEYNGEYKDPQEQVWLLGLSIFVMCIMGFAVGANDVANAWGTSVGSRAISVKYACIIAGLSTWLGAVTLGYGVSDTITKGVAKINDPDCWACGYCDSEIPLYSVGMFSALIGAASFLLLATYSAMPVSTTHAIIGGVVGITVFSVGGNCLNWSLNGGLGAIVISWVASPVLSGITGSMMYFATKWTIFDSKSPRRNAFLALPFLYGLTTLIMMYLILTKSKPTQKMAQSLVLITCASATGAVVLVVQLCLVPYLKKRLPSLEDSSREIEDTKNSNGENAHGSMFRVIETENGGYLQAKTPREIAEEGAAAVEKQTRLSDVGRASLALMIEENELSEEKKDAMFIFKYLLLMVATLESYSHGANDTANATAALSAVYSIYKHGMDTCEKGQMEAPVWIMAVAGAALFVGIVCLGYRVIRTIGTDISFINTHRGFCMEFASTSTVILATLLKIPVSTTHCQVGAVAFVSMAAFGPRNVKWILLGKIFLSWILTLPFAGLVAAFFTYVLRFAILS